jgi:hypothetical protein
VKLGGLEVRLGHDRVVVLPPEQLELRGPDPSEGVESLLLEALRAPLATLIEARRDENVVAVGRQPEKGGPS